MPAPDTDEPVARPRPRTRTARNVSPIETAMDLRRQGHIDQAIELLYRALARNVQDLDIATLLAVMLSEHQEFERAGRMFRRVLACPPHGSYLLSNYATYLAHSGQLTDARSAFRRAAAVQMSEAQEELWSDHDPDVTERLRALAMTDCNLARMHLFSGNPAAARDIAEKWLVSEAGWLHASWVVRQCIQAEGLNPAAHIAALHSERRASPDMVIELMQVAVTGPEPHLPALIAAIANHYLHFEWVAACEGATALQKATGPSRAAVLAGTASVEEAEWLALAGRAVDADWTLSGLRTMPGRKRSRKAVLRVV
ncbi:MAG: tetratricopeptide repeat protein [Myxococcota bacterium]